VLRGRRRETALDETLDLADVTLPAPEHRLVARERADALWSAFEQLTAHCRELLRVLMATPPPHYDEVSRALDMPVGSIGPTRQRCLNALRKNLVAAGITAGYGDS
jgi:DNA-directed RNA polymerase specialized sigma24 family protein